MASILLTLTPSGTVSNIPFGQDTTFSVVASASWPTATYTYQWLKGGTPISGATASSYKFDAIPGTEGTYTVSVSGLSATASGTFAQAVSASAGIVLQAPIEDPVKPFDTFDLGLESGRERHRRLRLLGYI